MSKRTTNLTPTRPPRGSLRKAKRVEMRKQKMANLAAAQAKAQAASQAETPTEAQEAKVPKGHILRQFVRNSIHLVSRKASTTEESHELSVELSGGKTISQSIVGIV